MLVSVLACSRSARPHMQAAPEDLNRAFVSYAEEARRGGVLWEGPVPDAAFAPDEVCLERKTSRASEQACEGDTERARITVSLPFPR